MWTLLLLMVLINRSTNLWKITCICPLCSIDKLSVPSYSIFSFLFQLQISSSASQIIKELCSFSSYSIHFRHLSFNGLMQLHFLCSVLFRSILFSVFNLFISYFLWPFYLLLSPSEAISKLPKNFRFNFLSVQFSESYKAMLQTILFLIFLVKESSRIVDN